jgi:hypothetical protein
MMVPVHVHGIKVEVLEHLERAEKLDSDLPSGEAARSKIPLNKFALPRFHAVDSSQARDISAGPTTPHIEHNLPEGVAAFPANMHR